MDLRRLKQRINAATDALAFSSGDAAVAVVLADMLRGTEVLLILRAARPADPWSGQMALPGGRREPADSDLRCTAVRETLEETGIKLSREQCLGPLPTVEPRSRSSPRLTIRPYVFAVPARAPVLPSEEVAGHWWVPVSGLRESEAPARVEVRGRSFDTPAFRVGPRIVWGLTHRVLKSLFDLGAR